MTFDELSFGGLGLLGADDQLILALTELAASTDRPDAHRLGRVVQVDRDRVAITDGSTTFRTDPQRSLVDDPDTGSASLPAIGDWVVVSDDEPPAVLALGPRRGRLVRRDPGHPRPQILAVGVDIVIVTVPLDRDLNIARVEREIVTAFDAGADPVIALTKVDLVDDLYSVKVALGPATQNVAVVAVQAGEATRTAGAGRGVQELRDLLRPNRTGVLLGTSGAGKSTLVNAIMGQAVRETATVRPGDRKGRHKTATRALVAIPGGGAIIDTPGLRALGLWDAATGLDLAFADVATAAAACRFADCTHAGEPGCGVRDAVKNGRLDADRVMRFRVLFDELVLAAEEQDLAERNRRRRADRRAPEQ